MSYKKNLFPTLPLNFNRRETLKNEATRMSNIHKPLPNRISQMDYKKIKNIDNSNTLHNNSFNSILLKETPNIHNFYNFSPTVYKNPIYLTFQRENLDHLIPKITYKEIAIPAYSNKDNFDLERISDSINQTVRMTMVQAEHISEDTKDINANIELLKKKGIRKIYHVYQEKYSNDVFATGLGDFIRSCFFIIQFASIYGFDYEIVIHHPIARFLHKYFDYSNSKTLLYNSYPISMFVENNWLKNTFDSENHMISFELKTERINDFVAYLTKLPVIDNSIFCYNIFFPIQEILYDEKQILRNIFQPSSEMVVCLNKTLNELSINRRNYIVLHIRSGDLYLNNETKIFDTVYINDIKHSLANIILYALASGTDILLIADNNEIKYLLKQEFPVIKCIFKPITHVGEGVKLEYEKIKNTMTDFYIMSYSRFIYSFTCYPHGSGFSYWCSVIYDIPYKCKYIKND